ncbi:hypothetical protein S7335_2008 [Synechococcus sp. PCC 7335]|uniref:hypothetical protein n=1 Tax=Synechococcus sp. (strain ATCC 29403 / PCC 7335) TaxID=91464 RepID=UPI00017EE396|nr:hypothetical protein [Synechococcus sp. PCC 7335]EDX84311.1 hypothetical protein S7335_2008 [Synechococcus sp. PCC 7335]
MTESTPTNEQAEKLKSPSAKVPSEHEVAEVIAELEQYKARLIEDFTATAKKAKLPKSMTMSQLKNHPEILKIEASLAQLRGEAVESNR